MACHNHGLLIVEHFYKITKSSELPSLSLYEACHNEDPHVLKYMITNMSHSQDINLADINGDIPLHLAIRLKRSKECIHGLIQLTKNVNQINHDGNTPLHEACAIITPSYDDYDYDYYDDSFDDPFRYYMYDDYFDDYYNYGYDDDFDMCDKCKNVYMPLSSREIKKDIGQPCELTDAEPILWIKMISCMH